MRVQGCVFVACVIEIDIVRQQAFDFRPLSVEGLRPMGSNADQGKIDVVVKIKREQGKKDEPPKL